MIDSEVYRMSFLRKIKSLGVKTFVGGEWKVAYRPLSKNNGDYQMVNAPKGMCLADPFLYEVDGKHYLFVELFDKKKNKACIGCYGLIDGSPVYLGKILEESYHMSYPCVFEYNGSHYMIPETSANLSIDLYKAVEFPSRWEKVSSLCNGTRYVDTTVLKQDNAYYAVSYRKENHRWYLDAFELDVDRQQLKRIATREYATNIGRPAGGFFIRECLMRPAQNCARKYGESVILYQVDRFDCSAYEEHEVARIEAGRLSMVAKPNRTHTYNCDSFYECVDVYFEKLDLLHGVKTLWRAYLRKYFKRT